MNTSKIHPTGTNVLVKRYRRPEVTAGGIFMPVSSLDDRTWSYWEVVRVGPKAAEAAGVELMVDDIIRTRSTPPVDLGLQDPVDDRDLYMVSAERITGVVKWK